MLLLVVHLAGQMQAGVVAYSWGYYPLYAPAGWVFVFFTLAVVVLCMQMYWQLYRGNRAGSFASRRGLLLFCGLSVAAVGAIDFAVVASGCFRSGAWRSWWAISSPRTRPGATGWSRSRPAYAAQQLMDSMSDGVVLIDRDGIVRLVNPAASEILGIDRTLLLNRLPPTQLALDVLGWQHQPFFPSENTGLGERDYTAADGSRRTLDVSVTLMREAGLEPAVAVITLRDITAAVQAQEQIERLAYYDPLTHLPNRVLLKERLAEGMARARRAQGLAAILFLDLDRFKDVNDTHGHDVGDMLAQGVAERISACIRETDVLLRSPELGGGTTLARRAVNVGPLRMKDTLLPPSTSNTIPAPYAHGYLYGSSSYALADAPYPADLIAAARAGTLKPNDDTRQNPSYASAAGGVISTADDLATWMRALVGGKVLDAAHQRRWLDSPEPEDPEQASWPEIRVWDHSDQVWAQQFVFSRRRDARLQLLHGLRSGNDVTLIVWTNLTISLDRQLPANSIMLKMLDGIYMVSPVQQSR